MHKLSLSQAWDECRMVLARDGRLYVAVALALVVLPQTVIGMIAPRTPGGITPVIWVLLVVTILIGLIAQLALNRLAIGPSTTVGAAIGRGLGRMPVLLAGLVMLMVAIFIILIPVVLLLAGIGVVGAPKSGEGPTVTVVFLILVITTFSFAIFQLMTPVAAAESGGPIHLLNRSWHLAHGNYWRLFAFIVIVFIGLLVVLLAGQFALGAMIAAMLGPPDVGTLSQLLISLATALIQAVFTVVFAVMLARIYVQLSQPGGVQPSVPSSGI
jgi:hypothetical protein